MALVDIAVFFSLVCDRREALTSDKAQPLNSNVIELRLSRSYDSAIFVLRHVPTCRSFGVVYSGF